MRIRLFSLVFVCVTRCVVLFRAFGFAESLYFSFPLCYYYFFLFPTTLLFSGMVFSLTTLFTFDSFSFSLFVSTYVYTAVLVIIYCFSKCFGVVLLFISLYCTGLSVYLFTFTELYVYQSTSY